MNKTTYRFASYHTIETAQSHQPLLPIGAGLGMLKNLDEMFSMLDTHRYDDQGVELEGVDRLMPDDIDWDAEPCHQIVENIATVLGADFRQEEDRKFPNETFKALNSHIVTGIVANGDKITPESRVLDICSGDGANANRMLHANVNNCRQIDFVGTEEFDNRTKRNLTMGKTVIRRFPQFLHEVDMQKLLPKYDLITCHHGIHHVLKTPEGEEAFIKVIHKLGFEGRFVGDFVDFLGLNSMHHPSHAPLAHVELQDLDRTQGVEGVMRVRVNTLIWEDPVLSHQRLEKIMARVGPGYKMQVLSGHGAWKQRSFSGAILEPPPRVRKAAYMSESRVISYVEIQWGGEVAIEPLLKAEPQGAWIELNALPSHIGVMMLFPVNKGNPLQPEDLLYLIHGGPMYAEKTDGVAGRVVLYDGAGWMQVDSVPPRFFKFDGDISRNPSTIRLQVEVVMSRNEVDRVVVLEPVSLGLGAPSNFSARLRYLDGLLGNLAGTNRMLELKTWDSRWDIVYRECIARKWEGVVCMMPSAPPPTFSKNGYARYIKPDYTVDLSIAGRIQEVRRGSGEFVRDRPDKFAPNTPEALRMVNRAVTLDEFNQLYEVNWDRKKAEETLFGPLVNSIIRGAQEYPVDELLQIIKYPYMKVSFEAAAIRRLFFSKVVRSDQWEREVSKMVDYMPIEDVLTEEPEPVLGFGQLAEEDFDFE